METVTHDLIDFYKLSTIFFIKIHISLLKCDMFFTDKNTINFNDISLKVFLQLENVCPNVIFQSRNSYIVKLIQYNYKILPISTTPQLFNRKENSKVTSKTFF